MDERLIEQMHRILLMEELRRIDERMDVSRDFEPNARGTYRGTGDHARDERIFLRRSAILAELGWFA